MSEIAIYSFWAKNRVGNRCLKTRMKSSKSFFVISKRLWTDFVFKYTMIDVNDILIVDHEGTDEMLEKSLTFIILNVILI